MQGSDIREIWARIIKLEKKVATLEIEEDNYEILGSFAISDDGGPDGNPIDVGCDLSVEERPSDDYTEDN